MSELTGSTTSHHSFTPKLSLGIPRQMSLPGVCRGALAHWRQLHAAMEELRHAPADVQNLPPEFFYRCQIGGADALRAALAIDPGYLQQATPPADLYARFTGLALRVYQSARVFSATLDNVPDLVAKLARGDAAMGADFVQQMLIGPTGLSRHACSLSDTAAAFATDLHAIVAYFGCDLAGAKAALQASVNSAAADDDKAGIEHAMGTHARMCSHPGQQADANARIAAARVTALAVISNMTAAVESLAGAWDATGAQIDAVAALPMAQLGSLEFLNHELHLAAASKEWGDFAGVIRQFVQPGCG
ncbi:MAG: hypothetical protein V4631_08845 [Pseudomonadota bacterium]